jgi:RNA polymerase sigma-70 factor (ECF subfamily)
MPTGFIASDPLFFAALAEARAAWPTVEVPADVYGAFLEKRKLVALDDVPSSILRDLYLACACAQRMPEGLRAFSRTFHPIIAAAARGFDPSSAFCDEVEQRLNENLFVDGETQAARIRQYAGEGPLAGFVATSAKRIARRVHEGAADPRRKGEQDLVDQFSDSHDNEITLLKRHYKEIFNKALTEALRQLSKRDRLVLRMNLVSKVSTTKIASMYHVSQPTVSRWIQRAAQKIFANVKDLVRKELGVDTREVASLLALVRSQIEITILQSTKESDAHSAEGMPQE